MNAAKMTQYLIKNHGMNEENAAKEAELIIMSCQESVKTQPDKEDEYRLSRFKGASL